MRSNDYLTDKQAAEQRLDRLQRKRARILRNAGPSGLGNGTSYADYDSIHGSSGRCAETVLEELMNVNYDIADAQSELSDINRCLTDIFDIVRVASSSKTKVRYLRDTVGMPLRDIAMEIGLSYQRVKAISAELNKS